MHVDRFVGGYGERHLDGPIFVALAHLDGGRAGRDADLAASVGEEIIANVAEPDRALQPVGAAAEPVFGERMVIRLLVATVDADRGRSWLAGRGIGEPDPQPRGVRARIDGRRRLGPGLEGVREFVGGGGSDGEKHTTEENSNPAQA